MNHIHSYLKDLREKIDGLSEQIKKYKKQLKIYAKKVKDTGNAPKAIYCYFYLVN